MRPFFITSFSDVAHSLDPVDGSLYIQAQKKDSLEGIVSANVAYSTYRAPPVVEHALPHSSCQPSTTSCRPRPFCQQ